MVFKIRLEAYTTAYEVNTPYAVYEAGNLQNFDYSANMPVVTFGMPEYYHEGAILTKAEGNTAKVIFTWVIKDEDTVPFNKLASWSTLWMKKGSSGISATQNDDDLPHTNSNSYIIDKYYSRRLRDLYSSGGNAGEQKPFDTNSSGDQIPTNDIFTERSLKLADTQMLALSEIFEKRGISTYERHEVILRNVTDNYNIWVQEGVISRISFQKAATDPVTWNATIEMTLGDAIASSA